MKQCGTCGTSFSSDKVDFCFSCGAPLPAPQASAVDVPSNVASDVDPLDLDVPEPGGMLESDEPMDLTQPIARPAGLDRARGPLTETPTGEVVLTEDLEIPTPMLVAPEPTLPVDLPSGSPIPGRTMEDWSQGVQQSSRQNEADTVPLDPVDRDSVEFEPVDSSHMDEVLDAPHRLEPFEGPMLAEPEALGILDEPTSPMIRPQLAAEVDDDGSGEVTAPTELAFHDETDSLVIGGEQRGIDSDSGNGMAMLGAAIAVLAVGGLVLFMAGDEGKDQSGAAEPTVETSRASGTAPTEKVASRASGSNSSSNAPDVEKTKASTEVTAEEPLADLTDSEGEQPEEELLAEADEEPDALEDEAEEDEAEAEAEEEERREEEEERRRDEAARDEDEAESGWGGGQTETTENESDQAISADPWGASEKPTSGRIQIRTEPQGATIWVDDKSVGTSPVATTTNFGKVKIRASLDGYKSKALVYDFQADPTLVPITLERMQVDMEVNVFGQGPLITAKLYVDGQNMGTLPNSFKLKPGKHEFRAVAADGAECTISESVNGEVGGPPQRIVIACD